MTSQLRTNKAERDRRRPMGGSEFKLNAPHIKGMHTHWFNDVGNRLLRAQQAGYEFVEEENVVDGAGGSHHQVGDRRVRQVVGSTEKGPMHAYLMQIPQKMYDEDQRAKQTELDEIDEALAFRGAAPGGVDPSADPNFYGSSKGRKTSIKRK